MTLDRWRDWYALVLQHNGTASVGNLVASWTAQLTRDDPEPLGGKGSGLSQDRAGWYWRLADGRVIRDREEARRIADALGYTDELILGIIDRMPSAYAGRGDARRRSPMSYPVVARALLIAGLVHDGIALRAACRQWIEWESQLGGPLELPEALEAVRLKRGRLIRDHVDPLAASVRRTWDALGIRVPA